MIPNADQKKPSFILLFLLISFGSINAVAFTPGLLEISQQFAIHAGQSSWTVSIYLIGYTVGQLLYGPLANRYGRKIALYIGIIIEIIASLLCVISSYSNSFTLFLMGRLWMALGASVGLKMSFTLVADSYTPQQARKILAHLASAFAVTPALGVAIGGFLVEHLGWESCFYFAALYGTGILYLVWRMPETAKTLDRDALKPQIIIKKYAAVLHSQRLIISAITMGLMASTVYIFAALAPFIGMKIMNLTPSQYGLWNLLPIVGVLLGSQLSAYLSEKISVTLAATIGLIIQSLGVIILFTAFLNGDLIPFFLFVPIVVMRLGSSIIYSNASSQATSAVSDKSNGSAMMTFISMSVATLPELAFAGIHAVGALLLPLSYLVVVICACISIYLLTKNLNN